MKSPYALLFIVPSLLAIMLILYFLLIALSGDIVILLRTLNSL